MSKVKSIWSTIDRYLTLARKIIVNTVTAVVLIFFTFAIIGGVGSIFTPDTEIKTKDKVLWFKPIGTVVDSKINAQPSIDSILMGGSNAEQHEIDDLLKVLNHAANDEELSAVYINVSELGMYFVDAFQIANAVKNIKDSGKDVIAYAENYGNASYLVSSQASKVFINEYGSVSAFGFSRKREFYKDLYENLNLNYHIFVAGDFKSGPETYTRNSMSEEDKLAWNEFAKPLWSKMIAMMEDGRDLPEGTIQEYGDSAWSLFTKNPDQALVAAELGLVDQVVTRESLRAEMFSLYPNDKEDPNKFPDSISIYEYLSTIEKEENNSKNKIAIVNVEGVIVPGDASFGVAGSDTIVSNIRKAIKDESVKAMVLRVNSPGGDVWASELITNALKEFSDSGRPIVSSMSGIAASGGVWVTTLSEEIWAQPETLTGSIGVYGIVQTLDGVYDWAGIQVDGTSSTKAGEWDARLPMPDYVTQSIQSSIENTYDKFVTKVSSNRDMPYKEILAVAGGRIWSGEKAHQLGLVDYIGGLDDAVNSVATIAELDDYKTVKYSKDMDPFDLFLAELLDNLDVSSKIHSNGLMILNFLSSNYKFIDESKTLNTAVNCFDCEYIFSN